MISQEEANLRRALPRYKRQLDNAENIISQGLAQMKKPYVSCSFGKDSVVLLHLVLQQCPSIPILFINSQYCFPDTYKVRDEFVKRFNINLFELVQEHDYLDIINQYGLPDDRSKAQQKKVVELLKKDTANMWAKKNGFDGHFWGLRKEESIGRKILLNTKGTLFLAKMAGLWRCSPLANWSYEDIWVYILTNDVPYSGIYAKDKFCDPKQIRNSSWVTTDGAALNGRVLWLKYYYPELFTKLARKVPKVKEYV